MLNLKRERLSRGMTQSQLGAAANVDPAMVSRAERSGYAYPSHLQKLADALDWHGEPKELLKEAR